MLLGACTQSPEGAAPAPSGPSLLAPDEAGEPARTTLRWALDPPSAVVPPLAADPTGLIVADALFDGLTRLDEDGAAAPAAAVRWRSNADATVWTFTLRPGAVYHDGSPVTAADVKLAWEEGLRRGVIAAHLQDVAGFPAFAAGEADTVRGVIARGSRTLQVLLHRPRADFAEVVAHPSLAPVPSAAWLGDEQSFRTRPVGNGPFEVVEDWGGGPFLRARAAPGWSNGPAPEIDEVLFRFTDPASGFIAFQQGRADVATVPQGAMAAATDRYGEAGTDGQEAGVVRSEAAEVYLLALNHAVPPFDEVAVRRAVSMAIDRAAIVDRMPDANAVIAQGLAPSTVPGSAPGACAMCVYAPDSARRMFALHGVTELEFWVNREGGHEAVAEEIAEAMAAAGVELTVRAVPFSEFVAAVETGEAALFRYGWAAEHPTLDDLLVPLLSSGSVGLAGGNPGGYGDPDVDELLAQARSERSSGRLETLRAAERLALGRDQAVIPVMFTRHRLVVDERVSGFAVDATGRADLTRVRVDDAD